MPNKTKQNTKNSTEQICSQPLYKSQTTHHTQPTPKKKTPPGWLRRQPPPTRAADAHTVLNVNPTVCLSAKRTFMPNPNTHPHPPPTLGSEHMQAQENKQHTNQTANMLLVPHKTGLPRKEVIQPHLPVRLPCYDFVPIANPTFDHSPRKTVRPWASGVTNFRDVTGGVYKARERIHRSVADLRLLATPPSWGRVADPNPN